MELANILADNQEFLKINNIEKAMGLNKTALVRMIARKEIPEKHKKQIEDWWCEFTKSISASKNIIDYKKPDQKDFDGKEKLTDYSNKLSEIDPKAGDIFEAEKILHKGVIENIKSNYTINTKIDKEEKKHKLWKQGDPAECSNAFYLRYGARTYDEIEK